MATSACSSSSLALLMVVMAYAATGALAVTYSVGDNQQWTTIPQNPTAYTDWASRQRFVVGDTLVGPWPDSEISGPTPGFRSRRAAAAPDAHGFPAITFRPGPPPSVGSSRWSKVSVDAARWLLPTFEAPIPNRHSDQVGLGPDSEISGPTPGFRSRRAAANRLSELVEKTQVSRNSESGVRTATSRRITRLPYGAVVLSRFFSAVEVIGTACEAPIPNRYSDPVSPGLGSEISGTMPGFHSRRAATAPDAHGFRQDFG
ncbi:hypothetical protein Taro_042136 [Colocasia esculenta]|uniref:Phytocyanin domain-containing protein n=1 Tax=Colocasia esculenta TaxID=4460 RepID=A0A843WNP6_COLES|nr:hypothetical protein [Colocasia esculenta]